MQKIESTLTLFFEEPFWVGVYERISDHKLTVCKITFGAEPKDYEVYEFLQRNWGKLKFSPPVITERKQAGKINPKRMQRSIRKTLKTQGIGTKSQHALKLQHETSKTAHREKSRKQKEATQQRKFELRQQKRKEKRKGR